jgi:hypothetical protein
MFRQSRSAAIVALVFSAMAIATRPALADDASASIRQSVANATVNSDFLVKGFATSTAAEQGQSSNGQVRHEGVGIGVKGGFLWPSFAEAQGTGFKDDSGWLLGIFFGGNRPGVVGVMGEIQYGLKKGSLASNTLKQYFVEIPILARINVGASTLNGVSVYGLVGPVFDINLQTKLNDIKIEDKYQSLDIGLLIGGGVEITRFLVEARYNQGFKNVLKAEGGGTSDIKSHSFAIEFGVRFN